MIAKPYRKLLQQVYISNEEAIIGVFSKMHFSAAAFAFFRSIFSRLFLFSFFIIRVKSVLKLTTS
jgi:hypothetical protein